MISLSFQLHTERPPPSPAYTRLTLVPVDLEVLVILLFARIKVARPRHVVPDEVSLADDARVPIRRQSDRSGEGGEVEVSSRGSSGGRARGRRGDGSDGRQGPGERAEGSGEHGAGNVGGGGRDEKWFVSEFVRLVFRSSLRPCAHEIVSTAEAGSLGCL